MILRTFHLILFVAPWTKVLREKLVVDQLVKKCPTFYETRRFVKMFRRICPSPEPHQCSPHHHTLFLISIAMVSYLCLGLPGDIFYLGFSSKMLYAFLILPCIPQGPVHLILFDCMSLMMSDGNFKL
jgi:hypothetical protein